MQRTFGTRFLEFKVEMSLWICAFFNVRFVVIWIAKCVRHVTRFIRSQEFDSLSVINVSCTKNTVVVTINCGCVF